MILPVDGLMQVFKARTGYFLEISGNIQCYNERAPLKKHMKSLVKIYYSKEKRNFFGLSASDNQVLVMHRN